MKKKVLFVTKALWIGGIEISLINLLNQFDYEKYDVTLVVLKAELDLVSRINPCCNLIVIDRENTYTYPQKYPYKKLFYLTEESSSPSFLHRMIMWSIPFLKLIEHRLYITYIRKAMGNKHFDSTILYSDDIAFALPAFSSDKYFMYYHHGSIRRKYHDNIAYKYSEKIIAVSSDQAAQLRASIPEYADKIITVNNVIDVSGIIDKASCPIPEQFDKSDFNIVTVGRVAAEKGMDLAAQACLNLRKKGYKGIKWWIIGDGPLMKDLKSAVKKYNLKDTMVLVGMKNNPYPYISQADLYVQPSRFESFGLTIMEALVLGKTVISTDTSGAKEISKKMKNCILCKIDCDEMTSLIERYYNDKNTFKDDNIAIIRRMNDDALNALYAII